MILKVIRHVIRVLPEALRHTFYRSILSVENPWAREVTIEIAKSRDDLEAAFRLLHDSYVAEGLMKPEASGMRVTVYHALPCTNIIVAKWKGEVVGTLSIVRNSVFGLPMDAVFDCTKLKNDHVVGELSALAIRKDFRKSGTIFFPLMQFTYTFCLNFLGVDLFVIAVNPKHVDLYRAFFLFENLPQPTVDHYPLVCGAPAVGMFLDLNKAYPRYASTYGKKPDSKNLFTIFTREAKQNLLFPKRQFFKIEKSALTPELFEYFFKTKTDTLSTFTEEQKKKLCELLDDRKFHEIIGYQGTSSGYRRLRVSPRIDMNCRGQILCNGRQIKAQIRNVSSTGVCAILSDPIPVNTKVNMQLMVADFKVIELEATSQWYSEKNAFGFELFPSKSWTMFIQNLREEAYDKSESLRFQLLSK